MDIFTSLALLLLTTTLGGFTLIALSYIAVPRVNAYVSDDDADQDADYGRRRRGDRAGPPVAWGRLLVVPLFAALLGLFLMTLYVLPTMLS